MGERIWELKLRTHLRTETTNTAEDVRSNVEISRAERGRKGPIDRVKGH